jgi:hypothetical protein
MDYMEETKQLMFEKVNCKDNVSKTSQILWIIEKRGVVE